MKKRGNYLDYFVDLIDKYPKHYYIFGFFVIFFLLIVWKVFSYTVLNYDFYKALADKQQIGEVSIPVTRWSVYSWPWDWSVLWTSVNLNNIAIDPMVEGNKVALWIFLNDILYKQMCYLKTEKECYESLLKFLRVLEIEDFIFEESYIKSLIKENLDEKLSKSKVTSVLVESELDNEKIARVENLKLPWIYIVWQALYVNPEEIVDEDMVATQIHNIIWWNKWVFKNYIRKRDLRYIPIFNKLSISISEEIKKYLDEEKDAIKKWLLSKDKSIGSFIILESNPHRLFPEKSLASQVVWFTDSTWNGHYWIEWEFNSLLRWQKSHIISKKDINWRIIDPFNLWTNWESLEWVDIYTTIDRNIQKRAEEILEFWVNYYNATKWTIVIMDPKTWAVKSMANYPNFDPNSPGYVYELEKVNYWKYPEPETDLLWMPVLVEDIERWEEFIYDSNKVYLRMAKEEDLIDYSLTKYKYRNNFWAWVYKNDVISELYEPGSIMKSITVAIWLDTWEIWKYSMYMDKWEVTIDSFTIENVSDKCLWYNSFAHALNYSCNVWMIRIAQRYWKAIAYEYLNNFWFSKVSWISLEWEVSSQIENHEKWSTAKLLTSSYGLWVSVTPLQMAAAYSVLANGWVYVRPRIIEKIVFPWKKTITYKPEVLRRVIKEDTSKTITSMLVDSINSWVAQNGKVVWYQLAWKTWTSQIATKWKYEEWRASTIASFAWYGPAEDPQFVIIVKLDRPKANEFWWQTAAFLFSSMAEYLLDYYSIPKKSQK